MKRRDRGFGLIPRGRPIRFEFTKSRTWQDGIRSWWFIRPVPDLIYFRLALVARHLQFARCREATSQRWSPAAYGAMLDRRFQVLVRLLMGGFHDRSQMVDQGARICQL